jgi:DNA-binding NarL/FixJ family response regulator
MWKSNSMPIRVILYEDNAPLRDSMRILFSGLDQFDLVGSYGDCMNIEEEVRRLEPDVILMDIDMPMRTGIEGAFLAKQANPAVEVLMLTVFDDNDKVFQAICAGASGYLLKKTPPVRILEAIEDIYNGGAPMTPSIARKVLELFPRQPAANAELDKLTPRELSVLQSLAKGNSYKMVADELGISIETVRTHIKRIYEKLHVHSVAEAIAKAFLK